jgi:hypothetical protein
MEIYIKANLAEHQYMIQLSKMDPDHQAQAFEIFQLFRMGNMSSGNQPLKTLVLFFIAQSLQETFDRPIEPLDQETIHWLYTNMKNRIRSRCYSLVQVYKKPRISTGNLLVRLQLDPASNMELEQTKDSIVNYLHRTVAEFLIADNTWSKLYAPIDGTDLIQQPSLY